MTPDGGNAPDVTIVTRADASGLYLDLSSPWAPADSFKVARPDIVGKRNGLLADHIAMFRKKFGDSVPSNPVTAARQLAELAKAGRNYVSYVLDDPYDNLHKLHAFFSSACAAWRTSQPRVPLVHAVSSFADYFPWEFLPLFDPYADFQVTTAQELEAACRRFLGFGAVVEHHSLTQPVDPILDATGSLVVRFVYEASYQGAQAELGFLRSRAKVDIEEPYPQSGKRDEAAPTLAQQLRDPTLRFNGKHRDRPDQIVHFACHCETPRDHPPDDYAIQLAAPDGTKETIRLEDFIDGMMCASAWDHPARRDRMPLVFLNACGTSVMEPASAASWLKPFADNHNRGFIGTMANVPDRVAARFSRTFYTELFSGRTAGEALHRAKWNLLQDYANPLGILYSLYADAGLLPSRA